MRMVEFGEIRTSALGFGCAGVMGRVGRRDSLRAMSAAWEGGVRLFDTARSYGYGEAEGLLGEFLRGKRDQATVATKFGILPSTPARWKRLAKPVVRAGLALVPSARGFVRRGIAGEMSGGHFDVKTLRSSLETSLRELRTDYVDVLLMHEPPVSVFQHEDLLLEMASLVKEGKVRRIGISSEDFVNIFSVETWADCPITLQFPWEVLDAGEGEMSLNLTGLFLMVNRVFGGKESAARAIRALERMSEDATVDSHLRDKIRGDPRARLAEIVFRSALRDSGAHVIVTSMLRAENVRANVAAIDSEGFSAEEMRTLKQRIVDTLTHS